MECVRITRVDHPLYAEAMALYGISFPAHEQREAASQARILGQEAYHFDAFCDEGRFVGEILYWELDGTLYIEHFCVQPAQRNKGYGQRILASLPARTRILEIDPPVDEITRRRKGFYERCGYVENPYPHVHPPYHRGNKGHELVIMSAPRPLTRAEYDAFARALRDTVMERAYE